MMPSNHPIREAFRAPIRYALGPSQIVEHPDGLLAVDETGYIAACNAYETLFPRLPKDCVIHDYTNFWITPGFVDCHTHLPQLDCRNKNGLTLLDWLAKYIYPAETKFADPHVARNIGPRFYDELLSHGITAAAIYSTVHFEATDIAFQIAKEKGLRAIIGQVLMDQNAPQSLLKSHLQLMNEIEKLIAKWHGLENRLFYAVTPRFALTCSKGLLEDAGKLAQEANCYFQTHLAETMQEVTQAKEIHSFKNYADFYEAKHALTSRSLFAHGIYLDDSELKILADHHASIAHCPTSNVFLKSGTMPFAKVEQHGIRCGLGSDIGAGPTFSMKEIIDCACKVHPQTVMDRSKAFYLATLGVAEALSLSSQIGNFAEGKWADFCLFDNPDFSGKVKKVFVAGQCIWKL